MELGKGKKYSISGSPIDLGLNDQKAIPEGASYKLRGETDEGSQRPKAKTETLRTDRGTFKSEC